MSTYNSIYGKMTILGDYPFGFDLMETVLPIMNELGLVKTTEGKIWEDKMGVIIENMNKTEEAWSYYDFTPWRLKYTDKKKGYDETLDCYDDFSKRVPLVPLPPTGSEYNLVFSTNYDGCFNLDFDCHLRDRDDRDLPYIRFWFETLVGILDCRVLVKVDGCNESDIIDIDDVENEQKQEWVKRYFKFYLEWHNEHYYPYRERYCAVVKEYKNKKDDSGKEEKLREVNRSLLHWHDFVLKKLSENS